MVRLRRLSGDIADDVGAQLERLLGRPVERNYLPGRPIDVPVSILSNELARRELGWAPKETLESGLAQTVKWYIDNRGWWEPLLHAHNAVSRRGLAR